MNEMIIQAVVTTVIASIVGIILSAIRDRKNKPRRHQLKMEIGLLYAIHKDKKEMCSSDKKWLLDSYDEYKKLGGNSYIDSIIDEMKGWE